MSPRCPLRQAVVLCAGLYDLRFSSFCPGRQRREVGRADSRLTPTQLQCWLCLHRLWEPLAMCLPLCQPYFPPMKMGTSAGLMALGAVGFMCVRILDTCDSGQSMSLFSVDADYLLCLLSPVPVDFLTQTNPCTLCMSPTHFPSPPASLASMSCHSAQNFLLGPAMGGERRILSRWRPVLPLPPILGPPAPSLPLAPFPVTPCAPPRDIRSLLPS